MSKNTNVSRSYYSFLLSLANMTDKIISRGTLQIPNAELDDSGIYVCRIENLLGVESWSVKLIVSGGKKIKY